MCVWVGWSRGVWLSEGLSMDPCNAFCKVGIERERESYCIKNTIHLIVAESEQGLHQRQNKGRWARGTYLRHLSAFGSAAARLVGQRKGAGAWQPCFFFSLSDTPPLSMGFRLFPPLMSCHCQNQNIGRLLQTANRFAVRCVPLSRKIWVSRSSRWQTICL